MFEIISCSNAVHIQTYIDWSGSLLKWSLWLEGAALRMLDEKYQYIITPLLILRAAIATIEVYVAHSNLH